MFSLNGTLKKKWVGRAMGNEIIYWDGLKLMNSYGGNPNPFSVKQLNIQISITVQIHDRTLNALKFLCFGV